MVRLIDLDKIDVFNQTSEQVVFDIIHAEPVEAIPVEIIMNVLEYFGYKPIEEKKDESSISN